VFSPTTYDWTDKRVAYDALVHDLTHLLGDERDLVANAVAGRGAVWHALPDLNWAGFYFFDGTELVVGPFQGLPACTRIALTRGVCGAAASAANRSSCPTSTPSPGTSPATAARDPSWSCRSSPRRAARRLRHGFAEPGALRRYRSIGVERLVAVFAAATAWPPAQAEARLHPRSGRRQTGGVSQAANRCQVSVCANRGVQRMPRDQYHHAPDRGRVQLPEPDEIEGDQWQQQQQVGHA
jgi:hypothetical protein